MSHVVSCLLCFSVAASTALGDATVVHFNGDLSGSGPGSMTFGSAAALANASFTTDTIAGQQAHVLSFAAAFGVGANLGLFLDTGVGPNGGGSYINQYTMVWDLKVGQGYNWCSLFQSNETNSNDGDAFLRPVADGGGIGISGQYHGAVVGGAWHRIALVVDQSGNSMRVFIDGAHAGTSTLDGGTDGRWSLYSTNDSFFQGLFILADNDGDMTDGMLNSFLFDDRLYADSEILALGRASAGGVPAPGTLTLLGLACAAAARRRRT